MDFRFLYLPAFLFLIACSKPSPSDKSAEGESTADSTATQDSSLHFPYEQLDEVIGLHETMTGDLDSMLARGRIRALVPYGRMSYYIDGPERRGLSYDAMIYFEKFLVEQLGRSYAPGITFIPVTRDELIPALVRGEGDLAVANLIITPARQKKVDFSQPFFDNAREVVVGRKGSPVLTSWEDLSGKSVFVRRSSSFFEHLLQVNDSLLTLGMDSVVIKPVPEKLEDGEILEMIHSGLIPMTVSGRHKALLWAELLDSLQVHDSLTIFSGGKIAWAMRKNSPQLQELVNIFVQQNRKGSLLGNILFNRYLKNPSSLKNAFSREDMQHFLSMRDYFIQYAERNKLDWLLLAAQAFQESRFEQSVVSRAGAVGVMQIKPSTAREVGVQNVRDLESNIKAGARYHRFIFFENLSEYRTKK
jgi:membrane-bound lytic murein transglycosylase MltF